MTYAPFVLNFWSRIPCPSKDLVTDLILDSICEPCGPVHELNLDTTFYIAVWAHFTPIDV